MQDDAINEYLDRVLAAAALQPPELQAVRAELRDHLVELLAAKSPVHSWEALAMLEREFGNPEQIGNSIGRSKGHVRTLIPRRGRRWVVRAAVAAALLLSVRWAVAEAFYIPSASLAPILPQGSRCLVYKLANHFQPGDVVVYRAGPHNFVGSVVAVEPSGALRLHRNESPEASVPLSEIVGRVVLNTR